MPIPTKYPTTGLKTETSCKTPDRNEDINIKKTRRETSTDFLPSNRPSYPKFLRWIYERKEITKITRGRSIYTGNCKASNPKRSRNIVKAEIIKEVVLPTFTNGIFLYRLTLKTLDIRKDT